MDRWDSFALGRALLLAIAFVMVSTISIPVASAEPDLKAKRGASSTVDLIPSKTKRRYMPPLRASGQSLVTSTGHIFTPHGVNAVYKRAPYCPNAAELTWRDVRNIAVLGFNTVRLGIIWKGLEPCQVGSNGCAGYDEAYLDRIETRVRQFNRRGVYVLLDFHQDLYSDAQDVQCLYFFTCDFHGEGAPDWATKNDQLLIGPPLHPNWGAEYFYPGVVRAFENLFDPNTGHPQVPQHYRDAWRHVAERFSGNPGVLGYDLFNEPSHGVLLPDDAKRLDVERLQPFFQGIIDSIREVDTRHTIYYEPNVTNDFGPPFTMPAEFNPRDPQNNLGLSYHAYCLIPGFVWFCSNTQSATMDVKKEEMRERGITGYLTEFAASDDYDDIGYTADLADTHSQGWNYWQWKLWDDPTGNEDEWVADTNSVLNQDKAQQLARTYPRLIAADDPGTTGREPSWCYTRHVYDPNSGEPSLCANQTEGHFSLIYNANRPRTTTTIFVPVKVPLDDAHMTYPNGYRVTYIRGATVISQDNSPILRLRNSTYSTVRVELEPR